MKTKLKLYNTLTRKKEEFKPLHKGKVGMYTCGLTVYNYGHIGNYRAFVAADILRRYLEYLNYKVKQITNITDVDDKTIKGSQNEKKSLKDYIKKYEKAYFEDIEILNIEKSEKYPKATEHIKEMVELIEKLLKKGYAYKAKDGIYFSIKKFKNYGKLAKVNFSKLKKTERIREDSYEKEEAKDFALWKFWQKEDGNIFWKTKIGKGRPGWHIECSAMSTKYLGQPFDIHTGGIDLIFPHHTNEIAQSEAAYGKKFVNFWIHNEWILVDGKKMSKSLGNYYIIKDIIKKGFSSIALRYLYLNSHYRSQLNFTPNSLKNAQNSYERLKNIIAEIKDDKKVNKEYLARFEKAMDNDLDTTSALKILWNLIRDKKATGKIRTIKKMDSVLGLELLKKEKLEIPAKIKKLVMKREKLRKEKKWEKADEIREKVKKLGFYIDDTEEGAKIKKVR